MPVTLYRVMPEKESDIHKTIEDITYSVDMTGRDKRPPVKMSTIEIEMGPELLVLYNRLKKEFILDVEEGKVTVKNFMAKTAKLRQVCQGAVYIPSPNAVPGRPDPDRKTSFIHSYKADVLKELLDVHQGEPLLVVIYFKFDKDIIETTLKRKLPCIDGATTEEEVARLLASWDRKELDILLVHPAVVASGLNMQKGGHNIIFYSQSPSLEDTEQLIGRLRRRDQEADCIYANHIVFAGGIDNHIVEGLQKHAKTQQELIDYIQRVIR
jgi:hypothetical protein